MPKVSLSDAQKAERLAAKGSKFKELAVARTNKALGAIANISGLANRASYDYTDEQVSKIEAALTGEVAKLVARFQPQAKTADAGFSLESPAVEEAP